MQRGTNMTKTELIGKVKDVIAAPSCCAEARAAAQSYLDALGTDGEAAAAKALVAELDEDVCSIGDLIAFAGSDKGKAIFGAEKAAGMVAAAMKAQVDGVKYCICPACTAGGAILDNRSLLLS